MNNIIFSTFAQLETRLDRRIPKSFCIILILFLSIKGKINFTQLARFSEKCEQSFRYLFSKIFDFIDFNICLIRGILGEKSALAFDPSFVPKPVSRHRA